MNPITEQEDPVLSQVPKNSSKSGNAGLFYALLTAIIFTTLEPVSKLIAQDVNPFAITLWRFIIGSLILLPFAIRKIKKEQIKIEAKDLGILALLGTLCICLSMVMLQVAVKQADAPSLIAIIFSANSVFTIIFAILILKEKMTKQKLLAIILCVIGVIICADFSSGTNLLSAVLAVTAALSFSLYSVLSKKFMKKISGIIQTSLSFFLGSIVLLIALLVLGIDIVPTFTELTVPVIAYLGIVVTGVGYWAYFKAMEKGGAMTASFAFFIKPILTPFATLLINGIVPGIKVFAALLFIVSGSFVNIYKKK